ncbi:MAG: LamG-like jellyroll fold domain-containing protein, partial [Bacteroidota bacterium]
MKKKLHLLLGLTLSIQLAYSQGFPEMMYFKFDTLVSGKTYNEAPSIARAGNDSATVIGLTVGGTGQFGTALNGLAGVQASNNVNPGWAGTHTGSWTISFWCSPPTPPTTRYYFGNSTGNGTFRCFIGGVAVGIRLVGGVPSVTIDMPSFTPGTGNVITYVYNQPLGTVSAYRNGVFQASASPGASYPLVGANFFIGAQGTSIEGPMDEFRMYNRALSATEVAAAANVQLFNTPCTSPPTAGSTVPSTTVACSGSSFSLTLAGLSSGSGQSYQWQIATDSIGPYANILNDTSGSSTKTQTATNWYRCAVTCSGLTAFSLPVKVTTPTVPLAGIYTVNPALPISATNYQSITAFATEVSCIGVSAPVVVNVAPNSGPYNSNLAFGNIT